MRQLLTKLGIPVAAYTSTTMTFSMHKDKLCCRSRERPPRADSRELARQDFERNRQSKSEQEDKPLSTLQGAGNIMMSKIIASEDSSDHSLHLIYCRSELFLHTEDHRSTHSLLFSIQTYSEVLPYCNDEKSQQLMCSYSQWLFVSCSTSNCRPQGQQEDHISSKRVMPCWTFTCRGFVSHQSLSTCQE